MKTPVSLARLGFKSLRFYWRTELSVLAGTVVASAVLVGALLVGDSVRYSLRRFALMRLGDTQLALQTRGRFVSAALAPRVAADLGTPVAAALQLRGIALRDAGDGQPVQVNRIQVNGVDASFWALGPGPAVRLAADEVALSEKLAGALGAKPGDEVAIRVGQPTLMPRDAPLASRKERLARRAALVVKAVVPDGNLGRFSLDANQIAPYNAFVDLAWLQNEVSLAGRANLLLAGGGDTGPSADRAGEALRRAWTLADVGISTRQAAAAPVLQLESDRIFLDPAVGRAALAAGDGGPAGKPVGVLTYLVNGIARGEGEGARRTPYSFMNACTPSDDRRLSPVPADMRDDQVVINRWLADQLGAGAGDALTVAYLELLPSGQFEERSRSFTVHSIVEMEPLGLERELMPSFPGLTDVNSCREWDIGMPMEEEELRDPANEDYWARYRATPKAFVTLAAGRAMWANRFGDLSAVRYAAAPGGEAALRERLRAQIDPAGIGLFFLPAREQALKAVTQAMDFGQLFLSMSFFLIAAALMLTGLLFVFGVQQRAEEMGTLLAVGLRPGHVRRLFLWEGAGVALLGAAVGAWVGTLYTRALIWGLATYWQGAVANSAIGYHAEAGTVAVGIVSSFVCAMFAIALALWRQARRPARELLSADFTQELSPERPRRRVPWVALSLSLLGAGGASAIVAQAVLGKAGNLAPAFFGAGGLLLLAGLGFTAILLRHLESAVSARRPTVAVVGLRNAARRRGRSLTAVGLLACGSFMVFAVQSMKEDIARAAHARSSGSGGFALFGETTLPVPDALDAPRGRAAFGLDRSDALRATEPVSIRVYDGDDASCFNLNRAQAPRLLGVDPGAFAARGAFAPEGKAQALWALLDRPLPDGAVPGLVGDSDTAAWGLHKLADPEHGDELVYKDERGNHFNVRLVGTLPMRLSVFQGTVLVSASAFTARFPSESGYRMFLFDVPGDRAAEARRELAARMDTVGLDVTTTVERLTEFYSVESTYLAMFLVLGGLGLLLGSVGMGIVVLRNVLERRPELALLRCVGLPRGQVTRLVIAEHWMLLAAGLLLGVLASLVAIWPNFARNAASVPVGLIAGILGAVFLLGTAWIVAAARIGLRGPLLDALRNE